MKLKFSLLIFFCMATVAMHALAAQQKGQYMPGQYGLNAGVMPSPGFTYANIDLNYSTGTVNNSPKRLLAAAIAALLAAVFASSS
jgi:hypothetical protein